MIGAIHTLARCGVEPPQFLAASSQVRSRWKEAGNLSYCSTSIRTIPKTFDALGLSKSGYSKLALRNYWNFIDISRLFWLILGLHARGGPKEQHQTS